MRARAIKIQSSTNCFCKVTHHNKATEIRSQIETLAHLLLSYVKAFVCVDLPTIPIRVKIHFLSSTLKQGRGQESQIEVELWNLPKIIFDHAWSAKMGCGRGVSKLNENCFLGKISTPHF